MVSNLPALAAATHPAATLATPATAGTPTPDQVRRFEALMDAPAGTYVAAPPPQPPAWMNSDMSRYAAHLSDRLKLEMDRPVVLDADATDLQAMQQMFAQNQQFMRVQMEFQYATKVAELGTHNLQTLYQMQG